ncbi:MAG: uroporphyrinogen decarboxylase family protein, partial [Defluviitaleaceae bacterium]|nr:uroporphyrinogen decarboxylase family protein [Defluviitaleaceae bacterium]
MKDEIKKRYDAFWERKNADRAVLYIATSNEWIKPPAKDLSEQWESPGYRLECAEHALAEVKYYAEGFPRARANMGPGSLAAMTGGGYVLKRDTVWFTESPALRDAEFIDADRIFLNKESPMYEITGNHLRTLAKSNGGRYVVDPSGLCNGLDVLSSLRGTQKLLADLYDYPEEVKKAVSTIDGIWERVFAWQTDILESHGQEGTTSWLPVWCKGRFDAVQCDFSAMISPDHFAEFVLPSLSRHIKFLDRSIYHWDGTRQIPHLDHLLSLPLLDGIQWTPEAGTPDTDDDRWFPLYERIQAAGKNLFLFSNAAGAVKILKH